MRMVLLQAEMDCRTKQTTSEMRPAPEASHMDIHPNGGYRRGL